jgi:hypothetical protein
MLEQSCTCYGRYDSYWPSTVVIGHNRAELEMFCRTDLSVCYTCKTCLYQVGASILPRTESMVSCISVFLVTM